MIGILWGLFAIIVIGFLVVDFAWFDRKPHAVSLRSATLQSLWWVGISLAFTGAIWKFLGAPPASDFLAAYLTEKMLSVDNLFVILLILNYFKVKDIYRHKVLYWGILGALILRGLFIGLGSVIVSHFHFVLYFFGAFLVYTGIKLFFKGDEDEGFDAEGNKVYRWATKHMRLAPPEMETNDRFLVSWYGTTYVSMLFVVLLIVETTDIMFAFDSIPAVFAITQNPFIAFTSNIFAVMGLRALFFLVDSLMKKLTYLQQGVSAVLIFIGVKMLADIVHVHISSTVSLAVIVCILTIAAIASRFKKPKEKSHP